jgi:16S rRNA (adenine1518-N6/adenine1519-N6)-dimethyltransferase
LIKAKKSLGQNFLVDDSVSRRIVEAVSPNQVDIIFEIGPGKGALTKLLLESSGYLIATEIDPRLVENLQQEIKNRNFYLIAADALNLNWQEEIQNAIVEWQKLHPDLNKPRVRVVANLPYYIGTTMVERLIKVGKPFFDMTLMLQEEVVDRMVSEPGSKDYGYLSVLVQYHSVASKLFRVPPLAFQPMPKVWSAILRLTSRAEPAVAVKDAAKFFALVRAAFAQRRKTILNNLKAATASLQLNEGIAKALEQADIDAQRRAETLSLEEFARLHQALFPE